MRIGIHSHEGTSLWMARRLEDEGHEVTTYIRSSNPSARFIGDGIIRKVTSMRELAAWTGTDGLIIWDFTEEGDKADALRREGYLVFGGGEFPDRLERKRAYAESLARKAGLESPPTHAFANISDAISFAKRHPSKTFYFKPNKHLECSATASASTHEGFIRQMEFLKERFGNNISNILQEKVDGIALSTAWFWNGRTIVFPIEGTIEHKKFMNSDVGPNTGCSFNLLWFYDHTPKIAELLKLGNIEQVFRAEQAPPGLYDINVIVSGSKAYFLEFTPRFGYDSEPTAQLLIGSYGETLYGLAAGTLGMIHADTYQSAWGVRVSVPPYQWEHSLELFGKKTCVGAPIVFEGAKNPTLWRDFVGYGLMCDKSGYKVADPMGLVGVMATTGNNLWDMNNKVLAGIKKLDIKDLQYRTDGYLRTGKDLMDLKKAGLDIPSVMG